jgi:alpha-beta hydrolase superfamily lysophospholipase
MAVKGLGDMIPKLVQPNGLVTEEVCSYAPVVENYKVDPFNHGNISLKLAKDIFKNGEILEKEAANFKHPVIMYFAEADKLTNFAAGKAFMENVGSSDKTFKAFGDGLRHESELLFFFYLNSEGREFGRLLRLFGRSAG